MPKSDQTEIRVVCALHGTRGHSGHDRTKKTMAKAEQSVIDFAHHVEMNPDNAFYRKDYPYRIQTRRVTAWVDVEIDKE